MWIVCGIVTILMACWLFRMVIPSLWEELKHGGHAADGPGQPRLGAKVTWLLIVGIALVTASIMAVGLAGFGFALPWWLALPGVVWTTGAAIGIFIAGFKRGVRGVADSTLRMAWKQKSWRLAWVAAEEFALVLGPLAMLASTYHVLMQPV